MTLSAQDCGLVTALFADAGESEVISQFEWLEPWGDTSFLVDVATEMSRWWSNGQFQFVLAWAVEFDVVAIMRTIAGHHRHHVALDDLGRTGLGQFKLDVQVRHPVTFGKAVRILGDGTDIGFQMHIRFFG